MRYTQNNMYFCMTPVWNMNQLERVSKYFNVNSGMKEFPADKQFTIWWISIDQHDCWWARNKNISNEFLLRSLRTWRLDLNIHLENHWNVWLRSLECQSLVQEWQHDCWCLDRIKLKWSMPCSHVVQLAGFSFADGFYSLSLKVTSICNWHSFLMKLGFTCRDI